MQDNSPVLCQTSTVKVSLASSSPDASFEPPRTSVALVFRPLTSRRRRDLACWFSRHLGVRGRRAIHRTLREGAMGFNQADSTPTPALTRTFYEKIDYLRNTVANTMTIQRN